MKHELLRSISYFSGLDEAAVRALAHVAVRRRYDAGQMMFVEEDDLEALGTPFYSIEGVKSTDTHIARME